MKNRYIYQISGSEWADGKAFMLSEVHHLHSMSPIRFLLDKAIADYEAGKFSYDGATFVKERTKSLFEVAAFIHDWRNSMGYVSKEIDKEMFDIMILLNYPIELIKERLFFTKFTFLNVWRHKLLGNKLKQTPTNLYKLNK